MCKGFLRSLSLGMEEYDAYSQREYYIKSSGCCPRTFYMCGSIERENERKRERKRGRERANDRDQHDQTSEYT